MQLRVEALRLSGRLDRQRAGLALQAPVDSRWLGGFGGRAGANLKCQSVWELIRSLFMLLHHSLSINGITKPLCQL